MFADDICTFTHSELP